MINKSLIIATVIILFFASAFIWIIKSCEDDFCFVFEKQKIKATASFEECAARGFPIEESYPRRCRADGKVFVESIKPETPREANIRVSKPRASEEVGLPLVIKGEARVFENVFNYRVRDADGAILVEDHAMALSPDIGLFGPFDIEVNYPEPKGKSGTVEVFNYSAKDGSEENMVIIPVRFALVWSTTVNVFFSSSPENPHALDCSKVYPVERRFAGRAPVARRALEELLKGPTVIERSHGYVTNINDGVKIQRLVINNGVAEVDFDSTIELSVGGSCRVTAIRAQITETLKQFPSVKEVIISVNGRVDDALQP